MVQLSLRMRMNPVEIERAIESAISSCSADSDSDSFVTREDGAISDDSNSNDKNSLVFDNVCLGTTLVELLIKLIRDKNQWDSISIYPDWKDPSLDPLLCDDLLLACTTHPRIRHLSWKANGSGVVARMHASVSLYSTSSSTSSSQHEERLVPTPTDASTTRALLYGLKYNSHLTRLDVSCLQMDAGVANLLSRALVRNTTLLELSLNETRFLSDHDAAASEDSSNSNNSSNSSNNNQHKGTRNRTVQTLSFGLRFNRTIRSLSLDRCFDLEDEDVACLVNAVNSDGTVLRSLSLKESACFDQGMTSIAVLLHENVIEELNLSYLRRRRAKAEEKDEETEKKETSKEKEESAQTGDKEQQTGATGEEPSDETAGETGTSDDEAHGGEASPDEAPTSDREQENNDDGGDGAPTERDNKSEENEEEQEEEIEHQRVWNTSLKTLAMAGNNLDDEYLESLLGVFSPPLRKKARSPGAGADRQQQQQQPCSALVELTLLGNRFSNHGIKRLLKALPQFPYLQRLYLGYQQPPPRFGPPATSVLSMGDASIIPELADRNTQFSPGSLRYEFLEAVSNNPSNFNLTEVNTLERTGADEALGGIMRFYAKLNVGGRRLLATHAFRESATDNGGGGGDDAAKGVPGDFGVPLGLWPLVLDRANRLHPLPSPGRAGDGDAPDNLFHAGDVVYSLLHGPMVFENLDNSRITNRSSNSSSNSNTKTKPRNTE